MPNQFQYQYQQQMPPQIPPQMASQMVSQIGRGRTPPPNIPHSRSETNFYRQPQEQFYDDFNNVNMNFANDFYQSDPMYNPNMMNRSYSGQQEPKQRSNYPGNTQPYIQNN